MDADDDRFELTEMAEQVWQQHLPAPDPQRRPAWAGTCPVPPCGLPMIILGPAPFPAPEGWEAECFAGHRGVVGIGHPTIYRVTP